MDNPLKKLFGSLSFGKGGDSTSSALGIDIGSSAIKIVEIKKKEGRAVLETYGSVSLGPYADTEIGRLTSLLPEKTIEALKEVLKQAGATTSSAALAIPVQSSLIFTIDIPIQVKDADIPLVVQTESRRFIPVPLTEVSLDYFMLPKKASSFEEENNPDVAHMPGEKNEVLAVAIQNDAIERYKQIVSGTSLSASFFEVEIFSSIRSNFEHELSLVLLIDFGASRTKLSLVEFGMVKSYHSISRGGADITEAIARSLGKSFSEAEELKKEYGLFDNPKEKTLPEIIKVHLEYIFSETNSVLLAYEKKYNQTISKVILTGGGAVMKGLQEVASNNFRADVEIGRPFSKVSSPEFLHKVLDSTGPEFAVAIGLALRKLQ
jgi:type IV pilus assembly protein PilM